ncbi:MAG: phosphohistidine phosphatase SixA [Lonepinella koalarum]|nr:phosphohistidine phosphatase SixA [Lonepinella koalarum]
MKVFVMRHGDAEMMADSDKARQLTEQGRKQAFSQGTWLKSTALSFEKVLVSPYVRAKQTFEQIDMVFDNLLIQKSEIWEAITPYGSAELVNDYLSVLAEKGIQNVLIISHLPLVSEIVAVLCGKSSVSFYPATIAEIHWSKEKCQVLQTKYP